MKPLAVALSAAVVLSVQAIGAELPGADLRMNQVQVLGSHNSYKQAIDPELYALLAAKMGDRIKGLQYSHVAMTEQLDLGLRSLEIDVVYDPEGGRFAKPKGLELVKQQGAPYDPEGLMRRPGFKVLHVPDIDFRTHAYTFRQALGQLKEWSDRHAGHLPIVITMNAKDVGIQQDGYTAPLPFDKAAYDAWDAEIREVLPAAKLITPDDVRGDRATLEAAVLAGGWPRLEKARGRFLFLLDETGEKMETYIDGHPSLKGRAMFVNAKEGRPEAAFLIMNEPRQSFVAIQRLVRAGYMVRTRADADTREARANDYSRYYAALASGAQVISTDYYRADPALGTGYHVGLPGGLKGLFDAVALPSPE